MKLLLLSSLVTSATAFAPTQTSRGSVVLSAASDYTDDIGVTAPLNVWDPMGKLDRIDSAEFDRLRALEIKHGRVSMLAVVGYLTTYAGVRFPGLEDVPAGWAAWDAIPGEVAIQMGATVIMMEMANRDQTGKGSFPGDFRNSKLDFGWDKQSADWQKKKRTIELNQGRAAQMGILGLMTHDALGNVGDILP